MGLSIAAEITATRYETSALASRNIASCALSIARWIVERSIHWGDVEVARAVARCARRPESLARGPIELELDLDNGAPYRTCRPRLWMRVEATRATRVRDRLRLPVRVAIAIAITLAIHSFFALPWRAELHADVDDDEHCLSTMTLVVIAQDIPAEIDLDDSDDTPFELAKRDEVWFGEDGWSLMPAWSYLGVPIGGPLDGCGRARLVHVVAEGDTLASIARRHDLDWRVVYAEEANASLFRERTPDRIFPGDVIVIPARPGMVRCASSSSR